jgi:hypothetical protein
MNKVVTVARSWVGREFNPGQSAQCANFVRHVFSAAGVSVGCAPHPDDIHLIPGEPQSPSYANSFAGNEIGKKITSISALQPGDIVLFYNTYGNWPYGVITHVGIYDEGGYFIHRPTSARPVERGHLSGFWADKFAQGRRPSALVPPSTVTYYTIKRFSHSGIRKYVTGAPLPAGERHVVSEDSWVELKDPSMKIKIFINDGKHVLVLPGDLPRGTYDVVAESSTLKIK